MQVSQQKMRICCTSHTLPLFPLFPLQYITEEGRIKQGSVTCHTKKLRDHAFSRIPLRSLDDEGLGRCRSRATMGRETTKANKILPSGSYRTRDELRRLYCISSLANIYSFPNEIGRNGAGAILLHIVQFDSYLRANQIH